MAGDVSEMVRLLAWKNTTAIAGCREIRLGVGFSPV
jgi:hypothetical protein